MGRSSGVHKVLVLAGTAEGRAAAGALLVLPGVEVVASLAGVTRTPAEYPAPVRTGGFGGAAGLETWLRAEGTAAVIDATHPFAARMPFNAAAACAAAGVPRLRLLRPEWPVRSGWTVVPDLAAAAEALPPGARAFLTTGREIAPFARRTDCRFWVRTIEPVPLPAHMEPVAGPPPSVEADELRLIRRLAPTHLVSKNSGGNPTKLDIARSLGIAVVMVARPPQPPGPVVDDATEALRWVEALVCGPGHWLDPARSDP
jgi:precorrin-6A/cobalt-precorrin-6A reductase